MKLPDFLNAGDIWRLSPSEREQVFNGVSVRRAQELAEQELLICKFDLYTRRKFL